MENWYKLLNRQDFGMIVNENGFQVTFKGHRIGGGGIDPQEHISEETRMLQKKNFEEMAAYTDDKILAGSGDSQYYKKIRELLGI